MRVISLVAVLERRLQEFERRSLNMESKSEDWGEDQGSVRMLWVSMAIAIFGDPAAFYEEPMTCPPCQLAG